MSRPNSRASEHGRQQLRNSPFPPNELSRVGTPVSVSRGATPMSRPASRPVSRGETSKYGEFATPTATASKGAVWRGFNSPGNRSLNASFAQSIPGSTRSSTSASRANARLANQEMIIPARPKRQLQSSDSMGLLARPNTSQDRIRPPVPQSVQEPRPGSAPSSHAQRVAQLHYDQFRVRTRGVAANNAGAGRSTGSLAWTSTSKRKASPDVAPVINIPSAWRPASWEIEAEMEEEGVSMNEAVAALMVGRDAAGALALEHPSQNEVRRPGEIHDAFAPANTASSLAGGTLNLKALMLVARGESEGRETFAAQEAKSTEVVPMLTSMTRKSSKKVAAATRTQAVLTPERAIAAVSILHGCHSITAADLRAMDLEEVPDTLRLFSGLASLSLCSNRPLHSITAVRRCGDLRAVDLSDCPELEDLRPLGLLPFLEAVDLSRCTSLRDLRPLLLPERRREGSRQAAAAESPAFTGSGLQSFGGKSSDVTQPEAAGPLGHPSLRWLTADGCSALRWGVGDLVRCGELTYVDLFGCTQVEPYECSTASQAHGLRTFVWPSSHMLEQVANTQGWSHNQRQAAAAAATASVADKLASARGRGCRPSAMGKLLGFTGHARKEALATAVRAACQMGLAPGDAEDIDALSEDLPVTTDAAHEPPASRPASRPTSDSASRPPASRPDTGSAHPASEAQQPELRQAAGPRIRPREFASAVRTLSLEAYGVEASQLFRMLDVDGDGGLSVEELCALAFGPPMQAETDSAIKKLLVRHGGACDAVAADLAGSRAAVDLSRIRECLCVAGIEETLARRVAMALAHCASGLVVKFAGTDVEAALVHALSGFAVARAAELTEDFRAHVRGRFQRCEDAFSVLDVNRTGTVGWEEFQRRLRDALRWPQASVPGACEAIFRVLDMDGTGALSVKAFPALESFEAATTVKAMVAAGRALSSGSMQSLSEGLRKLDPAYMGAINAGTTRVEFVSAWKELADVVSEDVDARIVFGLLDLNGNNCLGREELAWLVDALPRRAEAAAAGALQEALVKKYGTLKDAHEKLLHSVI